MLLAIINESTLVNNVDCDTMCKAIQTQLALHVAPAWNQKVPTIKFYSDKTKIPGYAWVINLLDNSTQAGALGYHSEDGDKVDAFIFAKPVLDNKGVILYDINNPQNISVSSVLSHEALEMFGDRFANLWADGIQIPEGDEYALELCDPVESDSYSINVNGTMVSVSNFIFPSWFNIEAVAAINMPFDYLKKLSAPFTMTAGGYMIVRSTINEQQVFGQHHKCRKQISKVFHEKMPAWKQEVKKSAWYRR